ncbi:MAG: methyltransferase domain-containing protein [Vicinamibacterales bacterium]
MRIPPPAAPLACSVRGCRQRLPCAWTAPGPAPRATASTWPGRATSTCCSPQDRRAAAPGDSTAAVAARARLDAAGIGQPLIDDLRATVRALALPDAPVIVDLGSGTGAALAALVETCGGIGVGIDVSAAAALHAARRHADLTWVVANADRRLPLLDGSVDLVVSLHARRNPTECARVLTRHGRLILALPAADDLGALRAQVLGADSGRDRTEAAIAAHAPWFTLAARHRVQDTRRLSRDEAVAMVEATYRGGRASRLASIDALVDMEVTLASDVLVLTPGADAPA